MGKPVAIGLPESEDPIVLIRDEAGLVVVFPLDTKRDVSMAEQRKKQNFKFIPWDPGSALLCSDVLVMMGGC